MGGRNGLYLDPVSLNSIKGNNNVIQMVEPRVGGVALRTKNIMLHSFNPVPTKRMNQWVALVRIVLIARLFADADAHRCANRANGPLTIKLKPAKYNTVLIKHYK